MYFNPDKVVEEDLMAVMQLEGTRSKWGTAKFRYNLVLFHAE